MIIGTSVFKMDGNPYYTPEFSRGGLSASFAIDVTHLVGGPTITYTIQHRNAEDTSFTSTGGTGSASSTDVLQIEASGLKEIVRIAVTFDGGDSPNAGVHFLIQAPSWRPY